MLRRLLGLLWLAGGIALGAATAQAHPHVWITAKSEVIYAPDGSISGVRHAWTFDDMFSTYALQGLETKTRGVYSREDKHDGSAYGSPPRARQGRARRG